MGARDRQARRLKDAERLILLAAVVRADRRVYSRRMRRLRREGRYSALDPRWVYAA